MDLEVTLEWHPCRAWGGGQKHEAGDGGKERSDSEHLGGGKRFDLSTAAPRQTRRPPRMHLGVPPGHLQALLAQGSWGSASSGTGRPSG